VHTCGMAVAGRLDAAAGDLRPRNGALYAGPVLQADERCDVDFLARQGGMPEPELVERRA
jgi:hypothetical protein